eukprot:jgi/Psemu1/11993/gm1.11993_g
MVPPLPPSPFETPPGTPSQVSPPHLTNPIYGLNINFTNILLSDGSKNLSDSANTITHRKSKLLENIQNNNHAFNTPHKTKIVLLTYCFTLAALFDKNTKASKPICTINNLERAIIFIDMNVTPIDVHNFDHLGNTSSPKPTTIPPTIPTIPNPAAAAAAPPTTRNTSNQQFVALFNQQTNISQQQCKILTNLNQSKTGPQTLHPKVPMKSDTVANSQYTFNHTHYQYQYHTLDQLTLLHNANITPPHKMHYAIDIVFPATSFLTHDGTYFILTNLGASSKKTFCSTINQCKDTTPYAFYEWYRTFQAHCIQYDKYCHPQSPCHIHDLNQQQLTHHRDTPTTFFEYLLKMDTDDGNSAAAAAAAAASAAGMQEVTAPFDQQCVLVRHIHHGIATAVFAVVILAIIPPEGDTSPFQTGVGSV